MKLLGIFAHPDDEVIWGWPLFQDGSSERHLIVVSDNHTGYGDRAREALNDVCKVMNVQTCACMNFQSEFYRLPTRRADLTLPMLVERLVQIIDKTINDVSPDIVMTHNPFGEYGHGDHRLLFNVVTGFFANKIEVVYTDACQWNKCHLSFDKIPLTIRDAYFRNPKGDYYLDERWFEKTKAEYVKHAAWSWGPPHVVPTKLRLFLL